MNFKGKYPHEVYEVFDNTEYTSLPASVNGTRALIAYISDKGQDGVIKLWDNLGTFLKENGNPNFKRHGQSIYNAIAHLTAGGLVYGFRIAAPDSTYANMLVKVGVKVEDVVEEEDPEGEGDPTTYKRATLKVMVEDLKTLKSQDEIEQALNAEPETNFEQFKFFPLFILTAKGKGSAGNGSTFRISKNNQMSTDHAMPIYNMEVMYYNNGVGTYETGGAFTTYLDPEYKINAISYYMENMSNKYLEMHDIKVNEDSIDGILAELTPVAEENGVDVKSIDFLLKTEDAPTWLVYDPNSIDLSSSAGFTIKGGNDGGWTGKLDYENWTGCKDAFTQFYSGTTAPEILDLNQVPASVLFDANYPIDVKNAMTTLVLDETKRYDMMCYLDLGFVKNATAAKEVKDSLTVDSPAVAIQGWYHNTYDSYTQKDITVTGAWSTAAMLANHDNNFGLHRPMAGYTCGVMSGIVENTLFPLPVGDEKATLYDNKINYVEKIKGQYIIASQITTQKKQSDLELINNNRLKGQIIRKIMALVPQFKHNFSDPDTLKQFKDLATLQLEEESRLCHQPITIELSQTQYQKDNRILNVELRCVFKSVIERVYVPIYLDKNIGTVEV